MTTETMTIHRGLAELKVLENRILKAISEAKFCAAAKQSMKKLNGVPIEDYKKDAQSSLDSINDLIARHDAIKRAISKSNAETHVTIDGVVYTVAEAIYMNQHGIDFKQRLLNMLDYQYSNSIANIETAKAKEFLQVIENSASYQFGLNHATGYSILTYYCAYYRYYYTHEFVTALLNTADTQEKIVNATKLANERGIQIMPIKFRHSRDEYR